MRGSARLVSSIRGSAYGIGNATGNAAAFGVLTPSKAAAVGFVNGSAERTRDTGLLHWLHVEPTEPQQLVWLVPQYGIDYTVETSTNLKWQIK